MSCCNTPLSPLELAWLFAKCEVDANDCWILPQTTGYSRSDDRRYPNVRGRGVAHDVCYHFHGLDLDDPEQHALHTDECGNAWCINPAHLKVGSPQGPFRRSHRRRIEAAQVRAREIRRLAANGASYKEIATEVSCCPSLVSKIVSNKVAHDPSYLPPAPRLPISERIQYLMADGQPRTAREIAEALGAPVNYTCTTIRALPTIHVIGMAPRDPNGGRYPNIYQLVG